MVFSSKKEYEKIDDNWKYASALERSMNHLSIVIGDKAEEIGK